MDKLIKKSIIYDSKHITLTEAIFTDGDKYEYIEEKNQIVLCVLFNIEKDCFVFVSQKRPRGNFSTLLFSELAGGSIEYGESAVVACVREVREETGYVINPTLLTVVNPSIGVLVSTVHIMYAEIDDANKVEQSFDDDENITIREVSYDIVTQSLENFISAEVQLGILYAKNHILRNK